MILIVFSIIVILLTIKIAKSLEYRETTHSEWKPIKLPLWVWILIFLTCIIPIINAMWLLAITVGSMVESCDERPKLRYKNGAWLHKLLNFFNKKY